MYHIDSITLRALIDSALDKPHTARPAALRKRRYRAAKWAVRLADGYLSCWAAAGCVRVAVAGKAQRFTKAKARKLAVAHGGEIEPIN